MFIAMAEGTEPQTAVAPERSNEESKEKEELVEETHGDVLEEDDDFEEFEEDRKYISCLTSNTTTMLRDNPRC